MISGVGGGGGGVVMLYCLLCPGGAGPGVGYFQVDWLVITVRVFRADCGQITRVGDSRPHLSPHTVNLASQQSSNQLLRSQLRFANNIAKLCRKVEKHPKTLGRPLVK